MVRLCPANRPICPKCGKNHENCEKIDFTCSNCGGRHMALSKNCPIYIRERKIRDLMSEFNCSYKRALTLYVPPSPPPSRSVESNFPIPESEKEADDTVAPSSSTSSSTNTSDTASKTPQSYAQTAKERKEKKQKGKKTGNRELDCNAYILEATDRSSSIEGVSHTEREQEPAGARNRPEKKRTFSWIVLWDKLKTQLLNEAAPLEDRIKKCIDIIWKAAISFAVQYLSEIPCLSFLNSYG
ncbi:uncharacterized protein LOC133524348 [Cydia pomonella]|uniref:uncharacterized protein LOC133524348 n=1 Tax=Cydia pomonella TaxID=82600 RepID=UPI002ADE4011|nr:uncharacterized protein LOC133524348 [Cydia pomonella]